MSNVEAPADPLIDALHRRMAEHSLGGHWQSRERSPELVPCLWQWPAIYSCLDRPVLESFGLFREELG